MDSSICEIVRQAETNYVRGTTKQGKYVDWSMYDTIETIDAYLNSKHTSGKEDSLGREKPFFNIVTAATNIWYRATDLDRKNIKVLPDGEGSVASAFIASIMLQQWMDKNRFGVFLNLWGRALARYGSAVVKFVEQNGELKPSVIPWNRFIADPINFYAIPRIEKFYKTPNQLMNMAMKGHPDYAGYDKDQVKELIKSAQATRKTLEGLQQDNESHFIELYEVHGELPTYLLDDKKPDNEDDIEFRQQMHVVAFVGTGKKDKSGADEYDDFTLYKGKEKKDPYMLTHLIEEDGRTLSIGSVELLFDAQWMQNHTVKQWKDQLDLASKLIFQTADQNFVGRNVLTAIETGDIMVYEQNKPLSLINNQGHDITSLQSFAQQWKVLGQELTSTPDAIRGTTLPSGTPYRLAAILQQEGGSLFEIMTENKGLAVEDMLHEFVLPHIKKQLDNKDEVVAILDQAGIEEIDAMYLPKEAIRRYNERYVKQVLSLPPEQVTPQNVPTPFNQDAGVQEVQKGLAPLGNKRFFKPDEIGKATWAEVFKDLEWKVKVEITDENKDKQSVLTSLTSLFQTLAQTDPTKANVVLSKIMSETGVVSPLELSSIKATTPAPMPTTSPPAGGGAGALAG